MHHDETGSRAVRQWLLYPFFAVPQLAGFELNADMAAGSLECPGFGCPAWHAVDTRVGRADSLGGPTDRDSHRGH